MSKQVQLFYAEQCGHCVRFKPEWNKLKTNIDKLKKNGKDISYVEYESEQSDIMKKNNIRGYPTIRIKSGDNVVDYQGERNADAILKTLLGNQSGGGDYKKKYFKYKAKYFKLLSEMEKKQ